MAISYDPLKRARTLSERGLDFDEATRVFAGPVIDLFDDRRDYGEERWLTYGVLDGRMVAVVWTERNNGRHIISMRKANDREKRAFGQGLE